MKLKHILSIALITFSVHVIAQKAQRQTVYSIVKQAQPDAWFETQARLWGEYLESYPSDEEAWLNYYTANRMLKIQAGTKKQEDLDNIIAAMEQAIPNSFEFHYATYWNGGASESERLYPHLEKAHALAPDRPETLDDLMAYHELRRNTKEVKSISKKWFASNDMAPGLYAWNYNMLVSCDQNAILITGGDNDTYPAMVLQHAKDVRPDVQIMNIYLIMLDDYRKAYFEALNIPPMEKNQDDFETQQAYQSAICLHLHKHAKRTIFFSPAFWPKVYESFKDNIYNVGMALQWCDAEFDNIAVMKRNYEKRYLLDDLRVTLSNSISQGMVNYMNTNYLVSMLTLYNHYVESEDAQAPALRALIDQVAANANMSEDVQAILNEG